MSISEYNGESKIYRREEEGFFGSLTSIKEVMMSELDLTSLQQAANDGRLTFADKRKPQTDEQKVSVARNAVREKLSRLRNGQELTSEHVQFFSDISEGVAILSEQEAALKVLPLDLQEEWKSEHSNVLTELRAGRNEMIRAFPRIPTAYASYLGRKTKAEELLSKFDLEGRTMTPVEFSGIISAAQGAHLIRECSTDQEHFVWRRCMYTVAFNEAAVLQLFDVMKNVAENMVSVLKESEEADRTILAEDGFLLTEQEVMEARRSVGSGTLHNFLDRKCDLVVVGGNYNAVAIERERKGQGRVTVTAATSLRTARNLFFGRDHNTRPYRIFRLESADDFAQVGREHLTRLLSLCYQHEEEIAEQYKLLSVENPITKGMFFAGKLGKCPVHVADWKTERGTTHAEAVFESDGAGRFCVATTNRSRQVCPFLVGYEKWTTLDVLSRDNPRSDKRLLAFLALDVDEERRLRERSKQARSLGKPENSKAFLAGEDGEYFLYVAKVMGGERRFYDHQAFITVEGGLITKVEPIGDCSKFYHYSRPMAMIAVAGPLKAALRETVRRVLGREAIPEEWLSRKAETPTDEHSPSVEEEE